MAFEIAQPYTSLYAQWYDFFISPAVVAAFRPCAERILDDARPGSKLLSVGCGGGQTEIEMALTRTDVHVTGLDLSAPSIARATRRAARAGLTSRMRLVCADAQSQPFADESFDIVFSPGSIKHWPKPHVGLRECLRVLRRGGLLLVMDADRGCRFDDVTRWLDETRVPRSMRPLLRGYFRGYVTGRGSRSTTWSDCVRRSAWWTATAPTASMAGPHGVCLAGGPTERVFRVPGRIFPI